LAGLFSAARFKPGLSAARVAAASAFLSGTHHRFVAAMMRARPSGLKRRFLPGGLCRRGRHRPGIRHGRPSFPYS
jgi:hypothetical protein